MVKHFNLGLIGYPLDHSLSPAVHQIMFNLVPLSGEYRLFPVEPGEHQADKLTGLLGQMRAQQIHGLNVTIPHKRNIMHLVDELTEDARAIGAVNVIYKKDDLLWGDNSDARGFYRDLMRMGYDRTHSGQHKVLIIGSGGAARAAAFSLLENGWHVHVTARRIEQVKSLAEDMKGVGPVSCLPDTSDAFKQAYDLIIHATPLGMQPHTGVSPWPEDIPLPDHSKVYDMIYNPPETALIKMARAAGLLACSGAGMLIEQAAIAFEIWTGAKVPRDALQDAVAANEIFEKKG